MFGIDKLNKDGIINCVKKHKLVVILLVVGVSLMIIAGMLQKHTKENSTVPGKIGIVENTGNVNSTVIAGNEQENFMSSFSYSDVEEKRLAEFLKTIKGVGDVEVIIYVDTSSKIINATEDTNNNSILNETDTNGGTRENITDSGSTTYKVIKDSSGNEKVVPIYTESPEIIGIAISAEGAGSNIVKENILNAVKAIYSIPLHKIEVLVKK